MLRLIFPSCLLLGGCVSLDNVVGGIANTPEWFQERRVEIRGEGYPDFGDVPEQPDIKAVNRNLQAFETVARQDMEAFLNDPRNETATVSPEDISQLADSLRISIPSQLEQIDPLLNDLEISALLGRVRPPPVNKPQ